MKRPRISFIHMAGIQVRKGIEVKNGTPLVTNLGTSFVTLLIKLNSGQENRKHHLT